MSQNVKIILAIVAVIVFLCFCCSMFFVLFGYVEGDSGCIYEGPLYSGDECRSQIPVLNPELDY